MVLNNLNGYKEEFKGCIKDLKHKKTFYKQIPNLLTFLRLVGGIPAGLMYYFGNPVLSFILIAMLWSTDAIDGKLARKWNIQSKLGADMDTIADKIMFLSAAIPLIANIPAMIYSFILEGVISAINVIGRIKGLDTRTVMSGKVKTVSLVLTLISGYLVQFLGLPLSIFNLLFCVTSCLQGVAIKDYLDEYKKMNKELKKESIREQIVSIEKEGEVDSKTKQLTRDEMLEMLKNERKLILATCDSNKVYKGKKRVRLKMKEKNNNYFN